MLVVTKTALATFFQKLIWSLWSDYFFTFQDSVPYLNMTDQMLHLVRNKF
jgi:hypothetical protein